MAPDFLKFFKNALNLIDLMSIVPFYIHAGGEPGRGEHAYLGQLGAGWPRS